VLDMGFLFTTSRRRDDDGYAKLTRVWQRFPCGEDGVGGEFVAGGVEVFVPSEVSVSLAGGGEDWSDVNCGDSIGVTSIVATAAAAKTELA
jgi:hypothetical protein